MSLNSIQNNVNDYNEQLKKFKDVIDDVHKGENDCINSFNETMKLYREILKLNESLRDNIRNRIRENENKISEYKERSKNQSDTKIPWPGHCLPWNSDWHEHCRYHYGDNWEPGLRPDGSVRRTKGGCGGWANCNSTFDQQYDSGCKEAPFLSLFDKKCKNHVCTDGLWLMVCNNTFKKEINDLVGENNQLLALLNSIRDPESPKAVCNVCNNIIEVKSQAELKDINQSCNQNVTPKPETPTNPTNPTNPETPTNPTNPTNPETPTNPTNPETPTNSSTTFFKKYNYIIMITIIIICLCLMSLIVAYVLY